jgi:hypothetical protein
MLKFYNNWLEYSFRNKIVDWKLNLTPEEILSVDPNKIEEYSIEAVNSLLPHLGKKIALCLSGGVDSQIMIDCFLRADVVFDTIIMRFHDGLNDHDINTAFEFCEKRGITPVIVDVDIISFFNRELLDFASVYDVSSPQFAAHFKLFTLLIDMGYTSAVCGGNYLLNRDDGWNCPTTKEQYDWAAFSQKVNWMVCGDFLSHYWKFSLAISCLMDKMVTMDLGTSLQLKGTTNNYEELLKLRYDNKIDGFARAKFDIIPQQIKYTGFEKVKEYFTEITKDWWVFDKRFRMPLVKMNSSAENYTLTITTEQVAALNSLYDKFSVSRVSTRI